MILEIRIKNCFSFLEDVKFSMMADMRSKRFSSNLITAGELNILKVAGVYGPNNSGKTCLIKCIGHIKQILLGKSPKMLMTNIFSNNPVCELGVTFICNDNVYSYDFHYNVAEKTFIFEEFAQIITDKYGNEKKDIWLSRDLNAHKSTCISDELAQIIPAIANTNLLCYMVDSSKFDCLAQIKEIITIFAQKIDIVSMNNIPLDKTINLLKNKNNLQEKVVDFIKNADMYLEDYLYEDLDKINVSFTEESSPDEKVLDIPEKLMDKIRVTSVYNGIRVPSLLFDSTGTKKIAALASYAIEALEEGKILIVDELDSSIHFKLTRAIVAMFNNELNLKTQLIFTVHDINLMDCKKMFRKEQIWFVHKDKEGVYLYPLSAFTAEQGIRDTTDIIEKYRKGILGALPEPELIKSLLSLKDTHTNEVDQ